MDSENTGRQATNDARAVSKRELLSGIFEGLADIERVISSHPSETVRLYENAKHAFLQGQSKAEKPDWLQGIGLSFDELAIVHQYLLAMSFMSAWYHIRGDKRRRDQATSPACLLVAGLGFIPEDVLRLYMEYERTWRTSMRAAGMGRGKWMKWFILVILGLGVVIWAILN